MYKNLFTRHFVGLHKFPMSLTFICLGYWWTPAVAPVDNHMTMQISLNHNAVGAEFALKWSLVDVALQMLLVSIVAFMIVGTLLAFVA